MLRISAFLLLLCALASGCEKNETPNEPDPPVVPPPSLPPNEQAAGIYHGILIHQTFNPDNETSTPADLTVTALANDSIQVFGIYGPQSPNANVRIALAATHDSSTVWSYAHPHGGWSLVHYPYQDSAAFHLTFFSMASSLYDFYGKK